MDNQQERLAFNKGWLVGIIDGEGSFNINKKTRGFYPSIQIGNTKQSIVDKIIEILKQLDLTCYVCPVAKKSGQRDFYRIDIGGLQRLERFFRVFPLDIFECKWEEAYIVKSYVDFRLTKANNDPFGPEEWSFYHMLLGLNR